MIGQGHTVADGVALIATLGAWNLLLDWLGVHVKLVARLTDAPPVLLVREGQLVERNMRRELVTREEVETGMREAGCDTLDCIKAMYMEGDGTLSVIKTGH